METCDQMWASGLARADIIMRQENIRCVFYVSSHSGVLSVMYKNYEGIVNNIIKT